MIKFYCILHYLLFMEKVEKLENCLFEKIVNKYNFFLSGVEVNITKNPSRNSVYFDPQITVTTQLVPNEYWDMKTDIYYVIKEETNLTPVLRAGWKIHWTHNEKMTKQVQNS